MNLESLKKDAEMVQSKMNEAAAYYNQLLGQHALLVEYMTKMSPGMAHIAEGVSHMAEGAAEIATGVAEVVSGAIA